MLNSFHIWTKLLKYLLNQIVNYSNDALTIKATKTIVEFNLGHEDESLH